MKEEITSQDITVYVNGFYYKIPYYIIIEDRQLFEILHLADVYPLNDQQKQLDIVRLKHTLQAEQNRQVKRVLEIIKGYIALHPNEFFSFLYGKLTEKDNVQDAVIAWCSQFREDDEQLKDIRMVSFLAGATYYKDKPREDKPFSDFTKAVIAFLGGRPSKIGIEIPYGQYWPCFNYVSEHIIKEYGNLNTIPMKVKPDDARKPESHLIFNNMELTIKEANHD